ncbi:pilus assembly protein PilX [Aquabacterium sp.]|jgi:type IV pilus assembly protein PilX|uniref:pilus assembly PilX family protein n=1 Tax=Aquabacterium sp. TaxID=1872578 RepID=UPI0025C0BF96|nr:pilus assembly protein PilX [Aquabacterium sp.]
MRHDTLPSPRWHRQSGASLIFALITLVSLSLAALALVRSVNSGTMILGNVGFKQDATASAEQATRQAIAWLSAATTLSSDNSAQGYYATTAATLDATGFQSTATTRTLVNWDGQGCTTYADSGTFASCTLTPKAVADINGSGASYVILRLCADTAATTCSRPLDAASSSDGSKSGLDYANPGAPEANTAIYYRIVVRITGPRDTASFTETIVQL